ncbi:MAG: hypothetical protein R6V12_11080 [Candidatus Hydrogenedentota bacterium]
MHFPRFMAMAQLDPFSQNLLCNPEVIAVNQDALGTQGRCVIDRNGTEVWRKDLEDGSVAIALFNANRYWDREVHVKWDELELEGPRHVRDLWREKDLGVDADGYSATLPPCGILLLRVRPNKEHARK